MIDFYVGGYAQPGQPGIRRYRFDPETLEAAPVAEYGELANPSWLLRHPEKPVLYAVEELSPEGRVAALAIQPDGSLRRLCALPSGGADPCHLCLTPDGRWLIAANYTSGSLSAYALDEAGVPTGRSDFRQHALAAPGANPIRQEGPHAHFTLCDGAHVYVCDLGMDAVLVYGWDGENGRFIDTEERIAFPPASGPRHLAFGTDGRHLYVLCELTATVHAFERDADGRWQPKQALRIAPEDFTAFEDFTWSVGAAIHFADDRTLYASCRGAQCVARFSVAEDGALSTDWIIPSGGKTPREFQVVGGLLLVANQDSDVISVIPVDAPDPRPVAEIAAVKPTCICLMQ